MRMTRIVAISTVAALLAITPALAGSEDRRLSDELEEAFRNLMDEMRPALDELMDTLEIIESIDSLENYERPEILPNGDIIIRRREEAPPYLDGEDDGDDGPGIRT